MALLNLSTALTTGLRRLGLRLNGGGGTLPLSIAAALIVGFLLTALVSDEPARAWLALLTGALPEFHQGEHGWEVRRLVLFGAAIGDAITLALLGLAIALPLRARQFSLGADGQMFLGGLAAVATSLALASMPALVVLPASFMAAMLAGGAWGLLPGWMKARHGANEIVTTLMFNLIAVQLFRLVITEWMSDSQAGFIATPVLPSAASLDALIPRTHVSWMLLGVPLLAWAGHLLLSRTSAGYAIRAVGQAPAFARRMGLPVARTVMLSMALGGVFAGLAGLHISHALLHRLPVDLPAGLGYEGLVVALLARNEPRAIPMAALLYAYLRAGGQAMERSTDVPREMVLVLQALVILFVVSSRLWPRLAGGLSRAASWARSLRMPATRATGADASSEAPT
jgi:general nucleoside transport system permease protein